VVLAGVVDVPGISRSSLRDEQNRVVPERVDIVALLRVRGIRPDDLLRSRVIPYTPAAARVDVPCVETNVTLSAGVSIDVWLPLTGEMYVSAPTTLGSEKRTIATRNITLARLIVIVAQRLPVDKRRLMTLSYIHKIISRNVINLVSGNRTSPV